MGNDALFSPHSESSQLVELDGLWTAVQLTAHRCSEASPHRQLSGPAPPQAWSLSAASRPGTASTPRPQLLVTCCVVMETDIIQNQECE